MVWKCANGWRKTKCSDRTYHRVIIDCQVIHLKAFGGEISGGTTRASSTTHLLFRYFANFTVD
jgi:hypothetical protein